MEGIEKAFISEWDGWDEHDTGGKHPSGMSEQEIITGLKSNLQSITDMIARRSKLKSAIVRSNAVTIVEVAGVKMTVAEAIERKGSIQIEQGLLTVLTNQLGQATRGVEMGNQQMQHRLDQIMMSITSKDRKVTEEEIAAVRDPFVKNNQVALLDPNGLQAVIKTLNDSIEAFKADVDHALSESNAITKIDV